MKKWFSEDQIIGFWREVDGGSPIKTSAGAMALGSQLLRCCDKNGDGQAGKALTGSAGSR
jgi:hypothetical protein